MVGVIIIDDVAVVVITIQATKRKFGIHLIRCLYAVSIMPHTRDERVDLRFGDLSVIVYDLEGFGLCIPLGKFNSRLIQGGLDPMAVHLFILYWAMLSYITP